MSQLCVNVLGYVGAILTTINSIPQIFKIIKTKDVTTISIFSYCTLATGQLSWGLYAIMKSDLQLTIGSFIGLLLSLIVIFLTIKYRK